MELDRNSGQIPLSKEENESMQFRVMVTVCQLWPLSMLCCHSKSSVFTWRAGSCSPATSYHVLGHSRDIHGLLNLTCILIGLPVEWCAVWFPTEIFVAQSTRYYVDVMAGPPGLVSGDNIIWTRSCACWRFCSSALGNTRNRNMKLFLKMALQIKDKLFFFFVCSNARITSMVFWNGSITSINLMIRLLTHGFISGNVDSEPEFSLTSEKKHKQAELLLYYLIKVGFALIFLLLVARKSWILFQDLYWVE